MKVIIIGGGQVGAFIAQSLLKSKIEVKVVEHRPHIFEKLKHDLPAANIVFGDGTSSKILESCNITDMDVLVAVTGADETNLVVSTLAKYEYGVGRVIARVNNPKNEWLFQQNMGVDVCLNQAALMSRMVIEEMDFTQMLTLLNLKQSAYSIVQLTALAGSNAIGKAVKELKLPQESLLVSLLRNNEVILPKGENIIQENDEIVALVHEKRLSAITEYFQPAQ